LRRQRTLSSRRQWEETLEQKKEPKKRKGEKGKNQKQNKRNFSKEKKETERRNKDLRFSKTVVSIFQSASMGPC
jgi:hypothetical protein